MGKASEIDERSRMCRCKDKQGFYSREDVWRSDDQMISELVFLAKALQCHTHIMDEDEDGRRAWRNGRNEKMQQWQQSVHISPWLVA